MKKIIAIINGKCYEGRDVKSDAYNCKNCAALGNMPLCRMLTCCGNGKHYIYKQITNNEVIQHLKCKKS